MVGEQLASRYSLMEQVGGGGMALVFKAHDEVLKRHVAIKVLRQQFVNDDDFVRRFRREAQAAAALSHPNVVSIYDVGQDGDTHYIVMEYIEGQNLNEKIKQSAPLQVDQAVHIASQICEALDHAHHNRIIHRDIKPHNILIGKNGRVKVTDFGIARAVASTTITQTGSVIGSVLYFSPEHAKGVTTDEKSDLYSLGIVMYQMLTNELPFTAETPISVALKHLQDDYILPKALNSLIPQSVENIIIKCLRKDPNERFQTGKDMQAALDVCLKAEKLHEPKITFTKPLGGSDFDMEATIPIPAIKANTSQSPKEFVSTSDKSTLPPLSRSAKNGTSAESVNVPKQQPKWVKPVWIATGILVPILIIYLIISPWMLSFKTNDVDVPDLSNQTVIQASDTLRSIGLMPEVIYEANETIAKDLVIRQDKSGMKVKEHSSIKLFVSTGIESLKMVSVTSIKLSDAITALQKLGIKSEQIQVEHMFSNEEPDTVIAQSPPVDTDVTAKSTIIKLTVSQGEETFPMPNLLGLTENEAKAQLLKLNLKLASTDGIEYSESYLYGKGQVWKQFPYEPNDPVAPTSEVKLFVSTGYPKDSKEFSYDVQVSPITDGEVCQIQITYSDARGNDIDWGRRSVSKMSTFPVRLVMSPIQSGTITVKTNDVVTSIITVSYDQQVSVQNYDVSTPATTDNGATIDDGGLN